MAEAGFFLSGRGCWLEMCFVLPWGGWAFWNQWVLFWVNCRPEDCSRPPLVADLSLWSPGGLACASSVPESLVPLGQILNSGLKLWCVEALPGGNLGLCLFIYFFIYLFY